MMDYTLGDTFDIKFTTRAFATGIPTTAASLAVVAYPDNSTTEITAGITVTYTSGFDAVAGLVNVRVVATSGNGYASGSTYYLVVSAGTVSSVSIVGEVVGAFTLGRSAAAADLANGTDGLGAIKTDTAAILADTGTDGVVVAAASKTGYSLTATTGLGNQTADITGSLSGSVGSVTGLTNATIADQVWEEAIIDHSGTAGSTAEALNAAGSAGDPWTTSLPGSYTGTQAGKMLADVLGDTNELQSDDYPTSLGAISSAISGLNNIAAADVWSVATRTLTANTNLNDPTAAAIATAVLTTAMTEAYNTDGSPPTVAQALHLIIAYLMERSVSGTTVTAKKLDGSTTAATFTLDDGTSPTSITRAT